MTLGGGGDFDKRSQAWTRIHMLISLLRNTRSRCSRATAEPVLARVQSTAIGYYVAKIVCRPQDTKFVGQPILPHPRVIQHNVSGRG